MVLRKKKEATVLKESLLATRRHLSCWGICLCLVTQSCPTLWDPVDCSLPGPSVHGILWARIVGNHSLLHGIFPTQELNPGLLHCRRIICLLSHQGSPRTHQEFINISYTHTHTHIYISDYNRLNYGKT